MDLSPFLSAEKLHAAHELARKFQREEVCRRFALRHAALVIPAGLLMVLLSTACAAAVAFGLWSIAPVLVLALAPLVFFGSLLGQLHVFFSELDRIALRKAGEPAHAGMGERKAAWGAFAALLCLLLALAGFQGTRSLGEDRSVPPAERLLLDHAFAELAPRDPLRINMYLVSVAGDSSHEVFRKEADYVQRLFARRFDTERRSIALVNNSATLGSRPAASIASLRESIAAIAARMDLEEDILFLFITSHGSREHELLLQRPGARPEGLSANRLRGLLRDSGIRWKVVVIAGCYSGGFIERLKDDTTMVITAAREDRVAWAGEDFTHFGRAFFQDALPLARSFPEAFAKARERVARLEIRDGTRERSLPQIASARPIEQRLAWWWAQDARR